MSREPVALVHSWKYSSKIDLMQVNDRVFIPTLNLKGTLRFLGKTDFKEGLWAGVELDTDAGKNDGSVNGYLFDLFMV